MGDRETQHRVLASPALALLGLTLGAALQIGPVFSQPAPTPAPTAGAKPVDGAYFEREIRPLLQKSCVGCHGVGAKLAKLDLSSREAVLKGGGRGPALVPGQAASSLLYQLVSGKRSPQMPPTGRLPAAGVAKLKAWIDGGAPWSDAKIDSAAKQVWWSFKKPEPPKLPACARDSWVRNPIDAFVLDRLRKESLPYSPPAPRRVLIRRAYLDMLGLPPSPEETEAFLNDRSPEAWAKVVDRLLASPHYGERWARHWLDLVRYAESCGFEGDKDRPNAWRYRDYVIKAFNDDKAYPDFIRDQLAGDEVRPGDPEALIATGYLAMGPEDFAMVKLPPARADELDDLVTTTGSAFLGLTVACARCHDHKYDPISQKDYYRLQAVFAPIERREVEIPTPEERRAAAVRNAELDKEAAPLKQELEPLRQKGLAAAKAAGNQQPNDEQIAAALPAAEGKRAKELQTAVAAIEAKRPQFPKALTCTDPGRTYPESHLLIRGDAYHPGAVVQPGFLTSLPGGDHNIGPEAATAQTTGRRKALAEWIASPENPLTARVWMNRIWAHHFGRGIVNTPSNFGINGELPTHPELLDWLALKFQSEGWRLKPIHRLILLSSTYQQASEVKSQTPNPKLQIPKRSGSLASGRPVRTSNTQHRTPNTQHLNARTAERPSVNPQLADPQDRYLWRMPVRRLEAEAIRDSILAVSGALNPEMGGPPVYPPVDASLRADTYQGINWPESEDSPKTWRRSVYIKVKRSLILPELEVFDCPALTQGIAQRNFTTTPTQALTMMNGPLVLRQAKLFAERLEREVGKDRKMQVERAYRLVFGRPPTDRETALSLRFLQKRPLADFCHTMLNLNEFVYVP